MIEIVFGESACGSLKIAQTYGKGKYRGSAVSIFMRHEDGSVPSSDEMKKAQLQAQEQERIAWENAIPLGGKSSDVYCFDMALSVGDISDNGIGEQRKNVFKKMLSVCFVEDLDYQVEEKIQKIKTTLSSVIERYVAGEEVRIWYSYNPDELCGMYWLMKQLRPLNCQTTIYLVKLPAWEYGKENTMTSKIAWGEVSPGEWGKYITLQEKAKPVFLSACAMKWNQLQNENAPLRAMLNGKLQSVSEDIYDSFILREIAEQPEQFKMAIVIGNVLGKYQLGISDVWISNRIDNLMMGGYLNSDKENQEEIERVFDMFPVLKSRRNQFGSTLSGGEQQMLAVGRAMMAKPQLLLLDEPSLGLAPLIIADIFNMIQRIRDLGVTVLLVEQNARMALRISDRGYVLETGTIVMSDDAKALLKSDVVRNAYLGKEA